MISNTESIAKTKILATLGPATQDVESIRKLIKAGVDGVRLNFSHGSFDFFEELFNSIHIACSEEKTPLAILADLQGPKIRIGELEKPSVTLINGNLIEITIDDIKGNEINKLVNELQTAGSYNIKLSGANLPSGVYYYKLSSGGYSETKKLVLLK